MRLTITRDITNTVAQNYDKDMCSGHIHYYINTVAGFGRASVPFSRETEYSITIKHVEYNCINQLLYY